jgi:hypothetical protein
MENGMKTRITSRHQPRAAAAAVAAICVLAAGSATAGGTISFGEDKSVSLGLALRDSFTSVSHGAPSGSRSSDFSLESVSLMVSASMSKNIKAYFSTDRDGAGNVKVKDAFAQFDIMPEFNIIAGRMLPPTDRANLDGPYYQIAWAYPGVVSQYPGVAFGRDDGILAWGKLMDKKIVYSFGAFEGRNHVNTPTTSNQDGKLLYAGRVAVNFWEPEPAPLYFSCSALCGKDVFTVALVGLSQSQGVGTSTISDSYKAWNVDGVLEKSLSAGTVTLNGAYYKYDVDETAALADGAVTPGKAAMFVGAFLFPQKVGWGKFQPYYRYQKFEADGAFPDTKQSDIGLNYIIDGPNAKISAEFTKKEVTALADQKMFVVGLQLQF